MQFRIPLEAQLRAQVPQRFAQQPGIGFRIQCGHLGKAGRGFLPRVGLFAAGASRIVLKNTDGFGYIAVLDQLAHIGLHVARRNAPGLSG